MNIPTWQKLYQIGTLSICWSEIFFYYSENFHLDFIEMELNLPKPNFKMVHKAFNNAITEFGSKSLNCWLEYAKVLIRNQPELVGSLNSVSQIGDYLRPNSNF